MRSYPWVYKPLKRSSYMTYTTMDKNKSNASVLRTSWIIYSFCCLLNVGNVEYSRHLCLWKRFLSCIKYAPPS